MFLLRFLFAIIVQKERWNAQNRLFSMVISVCSCLFCNEISNTSLTATLSIPQLPGQNVVRKESEIDVSNCHLLLDVFRYSQLYSHSGKKWLAHSLAWNCQKLCRSRTKLFQFFLDKASRWLQSLRFFVSFWNGLKNDVYTNTCLHAKTIIYSYIQRLRGQ